MKIVEAKNICKSFIVGGNQLDILKGINLEIEEAKLICFMGPSGSGKTTLINQLCLLDTPSSGQVYLFGKDTSILSENEKDELRCNQMGIIFQSVALISKMSAFENIDFILRMMNYPAKERTNRVKECLTLMGLEKRMNQMPYEMSGGEQQRVAIARAIAPHPKVIFADEPTAELDSEMGMKIINLFKRIVKEEKTTIIVSSHDQYVTKQADQVYKIKDGQVS